MKKKNMKKFINCRVWPKTGFPARNRNEPNIRPKSHYSPYTETSNVLLISNAWSEFYRIWISSKIYHNFLIWDYDGIRYCTRNWVHFIIISKSFFDAMAHSITNEAVRPLYSAFFFFKFWTEYEGSFINL